MKHILTRDVNIGFLRKPVNRVVIGF